MKFLMWLMIWDVWTSRGEWIELPRLDPTYKKDKSREKPIPEKQEAINVSKQEPIYLDSNLEQILLKVHRTLATQGYSTIDSKENFLQNLQKRILSDIWGKSHTLWSRTGVESRGHGHILSFPSLEGALMTISFLTFAVFLIKIVKQFIQGLQGGGGNLVGIDLPVTMVTPAKVIKHKRNTNVVKQNNVN